MQFLDNHVRFLCKIFLTFMGEILEFKKKIILVFSKVIAT